MRKRMIPATAAVFGALNDAPADDAAVSNAVVASSAVAFVCLSHGISIIHQALFVLLSRTSTVRAPRRCVRENRGGGASRENGRETSK